MLIEVVRVAGAVQFILGFLLLFFAFYCIYIHEESSSSGTIPYYAGAHIVGLAMCLVSLASGWVYHNGQYIKTMALETLALSGVRTPIYVSLFACPAVLASCVIGIILTVLYGLCTSQCSYKNNDNWSFNNGMAAFLLSLEVLSFVVMFASGVLYLKVAYVFGISIKAILRLGDGNMCIDYPAISGQQEAQDAFKLQKWRLNFENEVNFPKLKQYLEATRSHDNPVINISPRQENNT